LVFWILVRVEVTPSSANATYRIIFETDGKRVVNYRAGLKPQVENVEGCG